MRWLWRLNELRRLKRWPIKVAVIALVVFVVCFPYPRIFIRNVHHWSDPNALVQPDHPLLRRWLDELRADAIEKLPAKEALRRVESLVYEKVPYDWDWNTWGTADYMPTVDEILAMGKEDCDGRAVIAASLLRGLDYDAKLATNFAHVWVTTPQGDTMGPGERTAIVATEKGVKFRAVAFGELIRGLAFGTAVFPLSREMVVVLAVWLLILERHARRWTAAVCLAGMIGGLVLVQHGGSDYWDQNHWMVRGGFALIASAMLWQWWSGAASRRMGRGSAQPPSQSAAAGNSL